MKTAKSLVIFDLDGTLIDSMTPYTRLFCDMLQEECDVPQAISLPVYTRLLGKGPKAQFDAVLRQLDTWDEALVEDMTRRYWRRAESDHPALFPETVGVLETLERHGFTLVVSSGGIQSSVDRKLRQSGIDRFFRLAFGSDENVPELAKGAGHFAMIARALGLDATELQAGAVFVGDGVYDMQVAREAGIEGIGRLTGENAEALLAAGAAHVIGDLRGLSPLLDLR